MSDQYDAVRYDVALDEPSLPDSELATLYTRATSKYSTNPDAQEAWVRILILRNLRMQAAKRYDYRQNQTQENLSQVYTHLDALLKDSYSDLQLALDAVSPLAHFGGLRVKPKHLAEVPADFHQHGGFRFLIPIKE